VSEGPKQGSTERVPAAKRGRWWLPWAAWLVAVLALATVNSSRRILIGRMELPSAQIFAMSLGALLGLTLVMAWLWLGWRVGARRLGIELAPSSLDRRPVRFVLVGLLGLVLSSWVYARFIEPRWVVVQSVPLGLVPIPGVSPEPVRLVVLSDLHVDSDREPWLSLPAKVNALEPDLIVLLGDLLSSPTALPVLRRTLSELRASTAKLAVRGNWEVWYWSQLPLLEDTGFQWLDRELETVEIRSQTVHVLGWDYRDDDDGRLAEQRLAELPVPDWRIFAYHTPDLIPEVPSADLALAGHTHGGQVALPGYGAFVTLSKYGKRFERGAVRVGDTWAYVNPGIGVEPAIPLRFLVRPEITLVELGTKQR